MSERRNLSPNDREGGSGTGSFRGGDWSDDEHSPRSHGREKFRRERSIEREPSSYKWASDDHERYDRKKRTRRSVTPPEEERRHSKRRTSFSPIHGAADYMRGGSRGSRERGPNYLHDQDGDHYIPNYERDGYTPAPRYSSLPDSQSSAGGMGYPMIDMPNMAMMGAGWAMGRVPPIDLEQMDFIVSFKQYCEYLRQTNSRRHFDDEELQRRYGHYREKMLARQLASFFNNNKEKQWFLEKYHPVISRDRVNDTKQRRRERLKLFLEALKEGKYDDVKYDATSKTDQDEQEKPAKENEEAENDAMEVDTSKESSGSEYENHLVIKTVPPTIARQKIIEMCSAVEGFEYLALSEPSPNKKFHRIGWIHFKEGTDMKSAFEKLDNQKVDDFVFHLAMNYKQQQQSRVSKVAPEITNTTKRLQKDLDQAHQLAKTFESELGVDTSALEAVVERAKAVIAKRSSEQGASGFDMTIDESDKDWKLKKELDMILAYLRHVHMYCYYCALECDSSEEMDRRCVDPHLRKTSNSPQDDDTKQSAKSEKNATQWLKNLDQKINLKLRLPDDYQLEKMGGKILKKELDAFVKDHVWKEHEAKFKCRVGECAKAFKGLEYVEKHIHAKHTEEVDKIKEEVEYYNNYVCDPNHLVPANAGATNNNSGMAMANMAAGGIPFGMPFLIPGGPANLAHMQAAAVGTPWDQIPRIGFDNAWLSARRGIMTSRGSKAINERLGRGKAGYGSLDLDESLPRDPRQVKSYVDLDAPAEGEADISFY